MGADNLRDILRWREAERLLVEYGIAVYPRPGFDSAALREEILGKAPEGSRIELIDAPMVDISSTEIRERQAAGYDMGRFLM